MHARAGWDDEHNPVGDDNALDNMHLQFAAHNWKGHAKKSRAARTVRLFIIVLLNFQYSGNAFFSDLQMAFLASSAATLMLFILFGLGQMFHSNLRDSSDAIYQSEWHRYPCSVRRFVQLMIMRSQRPFHLSAHGIMKLTLENYVRVSVHCADCRVETTSEFINSHFISVAEMDLFSLHVAAQFGVISLSIRVQRDSSNLTFYTHAFSVCDFM